LILSIKINAAYGKRYKFIINVRQNGILMNIEQLSPEKLRIVLSCDDLQKYNLDYISISSESAATKLLITDILIDAKNMAGFSAKNSKLIIEVLPDKRDGCILYLTKIPINVQSKYRIKANQKSINLSALLKDQNDYILSCNCLDDTINAINCFANFPDIPLSKSALFDFNGQYHLIFSPVYVGTDKQRLSTLLGILSEYGQTQKTNPLHEALLTEHGNSILMSRAVENIMRYFN
jgi:adapter protein MecA 1/2